MESGPAAIYWNAANTASGAYTISVTLGVRSTPLHDAVGIIWGGSDLSGDKVSYGYFLVYGDGGFTVKHRGERLVLSHQLREKDDGTDWCADHFAR